MVSKRTTYLETHRAIALDVHLMIYKGTALYKGIVVATAILNCQNSTKAKYSLPLLYQANR